MWVSCVADFLALASRRVTRSQLSTTQGPFEVSTRAIEETQPPPFSLSRNPRLHKLPLVCLSKPTGALKHTQKEVVGKDLWGGATAHFMAEGKARQFDIW